MEIIRTLIVVGKKGRPINPNSARQQKLTKQQIDKETGNSAKRGRPTSIQK